MHTVRDRIHGKIFDAEHLVWTNGDSGGFTPLNTPMTLEMAEKHAFPDGGIYNDRQPWAWDGEGCDETLGCFRPISLSDAKKLMQG